MSFGILMKSRFSFPLFISRFGSTVALSLHRWCTLCTVQYVKKRNCISTSNGQKYKVGRRNRKTHTPPPGERTTTSPPSRIEQRHREFKRPTRISIGDVNQNIADGHTTIIRWSRARRRPRRGHFVRLAVIVCTPSSHCVHLAVTVYA